MIICQKTGKKLKIACFSSKNQKNCSKPEEAILTLWKILPNKESLKHKFLNLDNGIAKWMREKQSKQMGSRMCHYLSTNDLI